MNPLQHIRTNLVRGLLLVLPMIITIWLLRILFGLISNNVTPWVLSLLHVLEAPGLDPWTARIVVPLIGVVLTLIVVYLFGLLAANLVGRQLWAAIEQVTLRIPLVKSIYGGSRQLLDAFRGGTSGTFSRVVLVEYPRMGVWTMGFVTNESPVRIPREGGADEAFMVFFPTTPNPTSGWLALVPAHAIRELDISIEEGVKLIVSGGIVAPDAFGTRVRPSRATNAPRT